MPLTKVFVIEVGYVNVFEFVQKIINLFHRIAVVCFLLCFSFCFVYLNYVSAYNHVYVLFALCFLVPITL